MAWPFSRRTTYVPSTTPSIKSADLNAIQDAIAALFGGFGAFGDGSDGDASLDGVVAAPAWASLAGGIYTMTRDVFVDDLTLTSTAQIYGAGYRLFVNGTLTIGASAKVQCNGFPGVTTTGGNATAVGALSNGEAGGGGGNNGTNPTGGGSVAAYSLGGAGGAGGDGNGSGSFDVGAAGGTVTAPTAAMGGYRSIHTLTSGHIIGIVGGASTTNFLRGGAGGGGGGSADDGAGFVDNGGGGGGGGGVLVVCARRIVLDGAIQADGGAGGDYSVFSGSPPGLGAGGGGGGGGGGGLVLLLAGGIEGSGTVTAAGGAGGLGRVSEGATSGAAGSAGRVVSIDFSSGL